MSDLARRQRWSPTSGLRETSTLLQNTHTLKCIKNCEIVMFSNCIYDNVILLFIQAIFTITQLIICSHIDVSATIGGLPQELMCHYSLAGPNVVDRETDSCAHWIKEAIWIRKSVPTMIRNEGGYRLR